MKKSTVIFGLLWICLAIVLGAFGAHALKSSLSASQLFSFETAVKYQMYIGIILLVLGLNTAVFKRSIQLPVLLIQLGSILFSGSIYGLVLLANIPAIRVLGPITPLGGTLMLVGFVVLLFKLIRSN